MLLVIIYVMAFASMCLVGYVLSPEVAQRGVGYLQHKVRWAGEQFGIMFLDIPRRKLMLLFGLSPIAGMALGYLLMPQAIMMGLGMGLAFGLLVPQLVVKFAASMRKSVFQRQLVDCLMVLSSSLKAGLSLLQAFEVLTEEIPPPASQEFGLVLKETKMGVSLNEALERLKQRMPSEDLMLVITAVVVARETGGDVTHVFSNLIETIRERQKFKERIKTLTVIPRVQALIMACLPVVFAVFANQMSPGYFEPFFKDPVGQMLIAGAVATWFVSVAMMIFFSRIRV